jgi:hypothetical protein
MSILSPTETHRTAQPSMLGSTFSASIRFRGRL